MVYNYFKLMKFLALTALVAIVSAEACTEEELVDDANCDVTTTEGDVETVTCTPVEEGVECDAAEEEEGEEEEEASTALYASVASAAVAVTMMF